MVLAQLRDLVLPRGRLLDGAYSYGMKLGLMGGRDEVIESRMTLAMGVGTRATCGIEAYAPTWAMV